MILLYFIKNKGVNYVKLSKKIKSLVIVGALLAAMPVSAMANGPEKKEIDYVALGDSLAFGITPDPLNPFGKGYPEYLTERFEQSQYTVEFSNLSFPKKTAEQLKIDLNTAPVQLIVNEADYITIDIGANDILPVLRSHLAGATTTNDIIAAIGGVRGNLEIILKAIDRINPNAKVYVMGYYNPMPHVLLTQQPAILNLLNNLNGNIEAASINNGDTFVPTDSIIAKDDITYLPNPENIHLSPEGYQQVAKEFWKKIDKSKSN